MRTGALGGVAVKYGARQDAKTLAIIGSGTQARTQLEAAAVVRDLSDVRVYSRSEQRREAFATEMATHLKLPVQPVTSAEQAIAGADIVIVATSSRVPVFDAALIEAGTHVTTIRLGQGQSELDPSVADHASAVFTDSMEQVQSYPGGFFLADRLDSITDLSEHVARGIPVRDSDTAITLYLSAGLAGTEVVVADLALQRAGAGG
jgi:ornithine cyclodeaminase